MSVTCREPGGIAGQLPRSVRKHRHAHTVDEAVGESGESEVAMLLNVRQVAARLGCGRTYVFELLASGELPMIKLGRLTRVPASALQELIARRTIPAQVIPSSARISIGRASAARTRKGSR